MQINNFKVLENQEMEKHNSPLKDIHNNINSSMSIFRFIGNMAELFFSKFIGAALGVTPDDSTTKYPNTKD